MVTAVEGLNSETRHSVGSILYVDKFVYQLIMCTYTNALMNRPYYAIHELIQVSHWALAVRTPVTNKSISETSLGQITIFIMAE